MEALRARREISACSRQHQSLPQHGFAPGKQLLVPKIASRRGAVLCVAPNSACGVQTEAPQSNTRLYAACSEPETSKAVLEKLTGVCKIRLCRMESPFFFCRAGVKTPFRNPSCVCKRHQAASQQKSAAVTEGGKINLVPTEGKNRKVFNYLEENCSDSSTAP